MTNVSMFRKPLEEVLPDASAILAQAFDEHAPLKTYVLFSGGNDSLVLLHWATNLPSEVRDRIDGVIHVNTGIGIPLTSQFAVQIAAEWGWEVHELHPPRSYEQVFIDDAIINGLPGPGMHRVAYARLKERPLRKFVRQQKLARFDRIMFLTGIRHDESQIRMGYTDTVIDRIGAQVWVNPIYWLDNLHMAEYRQVHDLPKNPVSEHLHISGECLCGAFARPGELDEIAFFYPEVAERIRDIERRAEEKGLRYCRWGVRRDDNDEPDLPGPMCRACVGQMMLEGME